MMIRRSVVLNRKARGDVLVKLEVLDFAVVCLETAMQIGAPLRLLLADNLTPGRDEIADSQPRQLILFSKHPRRTIK
jgi:hypothetical protein